MTKIAVKVMPREVLLDTQGRAVGDLLHRQNPQLQIKSCRVGRWIELEFELPEPEAVRAAEKVAKDVLHNALIETYFIQVLK